MTPAKEATTVVLQPDVATNKITRKVAQGASSHPSGPITARKKAASKKIVRKEKRIAAGPTPAAQEVAHRVHGLHAAWRDTLDAHRLRVEGQFRIAQDALNSRKRRSTKALGKVRGAVKVPLKPQRGRAKDLRRVEEALRKALVRLRDD